jgi:hypothetical protein
MTRWPWIVIVLAAITFLNPIGLEFIHAAFLSGEQLSRNIAQPFVFTALFILVVLGTCEWWLKRWLRRRRAIRSESQHVKGPQ